MYIMPTTNEERVCISTYISGLMYNLEIVDQILDELFDDYYFTDKPSFDEAAAARLRNWLFVIESLVSDTLTEYALLVGEEDSKFIRGFFESAKNARANINGENPKN